MVAHGILDAYRRDKGLPSPQQQQQQGGTSLLEKAAGVSTSQRVLSSVHVSTAYTATLPAAVAQLHLEA